MPNTPSPRPRRFAWFPTPISDAPPDDMATLRNAWLPTRPGREDLAELLTLDEAEVLSGRTHDTLTRWLSLGMLSGQSAPESRDVLIRAAELRALLANFAPVPTAPATDWDLVRVLQARIDDLRERVADLRQQVGDLRCERDGLRANLVAEREEREDPGVIRRLIGW